MIQFFEFNFLTLEQSCTLLLSVSENEKIHLVFGRFRIPALNIFGIREG